MRRYKSFIVVSLLTSLTFSAFSTFEKTKEIRPNLVMSWKVEDGQRIRFLIEKNERGHAWLGPGSSMSLGGVFRIAKTSGGNDLEVTECKLVGTTTPNCSGEQNFQIVDKEATPNSFKVEILRDLDTGDSDDVVISRSHNNFIWSVTSNDTPEMHGGASERGVIRINLKDGSGGEYRLSKWGDGTYMIHEHGHLLLWTILADSMIIVGKYWKGLNRYFDIHAVTFFIIVVLNIVFAQFAPDLGGGEDDRILISYDEDRSFSHRERILANALANGDSHEFYANITIILTYLITFNGIILRFAITLGQRYKYFHLKGRRFDISITRRIHTILGIITWIFARLACLTGTALHEISYGSLLFILLIVETVIAFLLFILFEVLYRIKRKHWKANFAMKTAKDDPETQTILRLLREKCKRIHLKKQALLKSLRRNTRTEIFIFT